MKTIIPILFILLATFANANSEASIDKLQRVSKATETVTVFLSIALNVPKNTIKITRFTEINPSSYLFDVDAVNKACKVSLTENLFLTKYGWLVDEHSCVER